MYHLKLFKNLSFQFQDPEFDPEFDWVTVAKQKKFAALEDNQLKFNRLINLLIVFTAELGRPNILML